MNRYRCVVNVGRDPGVVCGHAVHDLKRCTLKWGLCKYQRPEVTRAAVGREKHRVKATGVKLVT